ncbi:MAG: hybrid sensor histidine kinase/response regulator [Lacunisphaera sp.]|nr:hybrid sensor histidine kinase/response regulator [Lacunisphaera sp.]
MNSLSHAKILIVEDDDTVRQTLADILELNGYQAVMAKNGTEGLAAAKSESPTVIITDVAMPGLNGFELLEAFRADPDLRTVPIIVVSASIDRAATRRGMELGAADFITKPFTENEVLLSVAARLEKLELLKELDAFAHTVAHDLKNPLGTLCGRLYLLGAKLGQADAAALQRDLREAQNSANRLNEIIEELLVLTGVRRQTVSPAPLDMRAIVAEATDRLEELLGRQSARINQAETWPVAFGHAPWIIEIWVNFISNAAKYGGASPQITLGGETSADGRFARFWAQDQGPGLDAAAQQKMFVPFASISTVRADGHGLGLSIVRRIAEKLGGTVGVDSRPGAGARFWFELPTEAKPRSGAPFLFAP